MGFHDEREGKAKKIRTDIMFIKGEKQLIKM